MNMKTKHLIAGLCIASLFAVGACGNKKEEEARAAAAAAATAEWETYNADLPKMVSAIQSRVDILSQSKKLPANLSKESFDSAKLGLDLINATWAEATAAAASGNPVDAVAKAKVVQEKGAEVMGLLGMTTG
jgi:hypothetical protein